MTSRSRVHRWTGRGVPLAVVAALGAAVPLAAGTPATASTAPPSAAALVAESSSAMAAAGSVSAVGSGTVAIPGEGNVVLAESNYTAQTSGSESLKMTTAHGRSLASGSLRLVDGALFINGNTGYWTNGAGLSSSQAAPLAGRWVEVPSSSPLFTQSAEDLTMSSFISDIFDGQTYHLGPVTSVRGVKAYKITYTSTGNDASGPTTAYLAVAGRHLLVSASNSGLTLHFGPWGKARTVAAPTGAVPLPAGVG